MIKNIIFSALMFDLLLAISLALFGVHHVSLGAPFMSFMSTTSLQLKDFNFSIPDIPKISDSIYVALDNADNIFDWFKAFTSGLFDFINFLINILNFIVFLINNLIQILRFVYIMLTNFKELRDILVAQ